MSSHWSGSVQIIRLNISGRRFEIDRNTACRYPDSVFGMLASESSEKEPTLRAKGIYENGTGEWYAQRPISAFGLIVDYLCLGRLHCPQAVCKEVLKRELAFWRLDNVPLADCCWVEEDEDQEMTMDRKKDTHSHCPHSSTVSMYSTKIVLTLRKAVASNNSSNIAKIFSGLSILFILLAIVNITVSTIPVLQTCTNPDSEGSNISEIISTDDSSIITNGSIRTKRRILGLKYRDHCEGNVVFEIIEAICMGWFTFEWILRFSLALDKRTFLKSPLNIIDLLAVLPFYVDLLIWLIDANTSDRQSSAQQFLTLLRVFRIFRLFNVIRLARYSESIRLLCASMWQTRNEFGVLVVFIIFLVMIFSSAVFYCEKDMDGTLFTSIPMSLWTTTGYGDMVPQSIPGKALASICCTIGLVVMAFPISILVDHFHRLYKRRVNRSFNRLAIIVAPNQVGITRGVKRGKNPRYGHLQITKL